MPSTLSSTLPEPLQRFLAGARVRRGRLAVFIGVVALAAIGLSLLLPNWYSAESTLLPPSDSSDSFGIMSGLIENAALSRLGLTPTQTPSEVFAEILRSRALRESLVVQFDLRQRYKMKNMDLALKELGTHVRVDVRPSGVVTLAVEDRDRERASRMTNALVDALDRFNRESMNTRAKRTRQFLEQRLDDVHNRLTQAESTLASYERQHKLITSSEGAAVQGAAGVIARRLDLQVQRSYVGGYTRPGSPVLRQIDAELEALDREITKLPGIKEEGARLALDAEIQRRVFTLLTAQYEDSRIQEARDTPTVTILDRARAPDLKSRPRRSLLVVGATLAAALMASAWVALSVREPGAA